MSQALPWTGLGEGAGGRGGFGASSLGSEAEGAIATEEDMSAAEEEASVGDDTGGLGGDADAEDMSVDLLSLLEIVHWYLYSAQVTSAQQA